MAHIADEPAWNTLPQTMGASTTFEDFFATERDRILRIMSVITGNYEEAEDITQDAFLKVWERWDRVAEMDSPVGYLQRIALNVFRSRVRRSALAVSHRVSSPQRASRCRRPATKARCRFSPPMFPSRFAASP